MFNRGYKVEQLRVFELILPMLGDVEHVEDQLPIVLYSKTFLKIESLMLISISNMNNRYGIDKIGSPKK